MNENDTEDPDRPRPARAREPDYEARERVVRVPITKRPTQEISLEEIQREVKKAASGRTSRYLGAALAALLTGGGGTAAWETFGHGGGDDDAQAKRELRDMKKKLDTLEEQLTSVRIEQARCCK